MNARPGGGRSAAITATLLLAALLAAAGATSWGRELGARFARTSAPERALGSPRLRAALVRERILAPQPPAESTAGDAGDDCPEIELGPDRLAPEDTPSTRSAPLAARHGGRPFFSLWLDSCRFARLHARPKAHGRETEELGWVSIFDGGELLLSTAVGIRMHGGASRKEPPYSYRLYFRDAYGLAGAPADLLAAGLEGAISRLILAELDDRDRDGSPWPFPGEVAYAIGRRLGAEAPASRAVWMSWNGETPRPMSAIEHLGPDFLRRRYGHEEFDLVRGKRDPGDPHEATVSAELDWIAERPAPLLAAAAAGRYDLDSLLHWLVSVVYCGTGDLYQDAMVRDRSGAVREGRWFWIHWDHDMSFRTPPGNSRFGRFGDALHFVLWSQRRSDVAPARALLVRLLREDPAFRERVRERFERALRDELTGEFLLATIAHFEREARAVGFSDTHFADRLRAHVEARPAQIREQLERVLAALAEERLERPLGLVRRRARSANVRP